MTLAAEERKADLVQRLAAEAQKKGGEAAATFVRRYFALVAPDDIIYTSVDTLLGGVLSLWDYGKERKPGCPKVRLYNPSVEKNGWSLEHTIVEVINDDMPFLVDSVTAEINRRERNIHLLLHPVVRVQRDAKGNRLGIATTDDAITESYMHIEMDQETEPAELDLICRSIEKVLADVRVSVADWRTMRQRLQENIHELEGKKLPMPPEE